MKQPLRLVALAGSFLFAATATTACVGPPAVELAGKNQVSCPITPREDITTTARVGWMGVANGDLIVHEAGWLTACMPNAKIEVQRFDAGADVLQAFGANSVDLAMNGSAATAKALSNPLNLDIQVPWVYDYIGTAESLVAKDTSATSLASLKGKTIAVPSGSTTHYSLLSAIKQAGLNADDFKITFMAPDKMLAGWQSSQIDACWVWDPTLTKLTDQGGKIVMSSADTAKAGAPTFDAANVSRTFAEQNPDFMEVWTELESLAAQMISEKPDEAAGYIATRLGLEPAVVKTQLKGYTYPAASEQTDPGEALAKTAEFLQQTGQGTANAPATYQQAWTGPKN